MPPTNEELQTLAYYNQVLFDLHEHLRRVRRFPTNEQAAPIRALFNDGKKIIMCQCGRSFGKTEDNLYIAWRFALTTPGAEVYIVCPERLQAKKIYWLRKRLQYYGPQKYVREHRESELRTVFKNGSYICLDGCENYEALRGIKPSLVIYDEFQHHTHEFDEEVMQPNLASGTPLIVMGTPPKSDCYYVEFRENHIAAINGGDETRFYMELPTWCNPTQNRIWLENKRQELLRRKRYNVWLREYEAKLVFDTDSAIFPTFDKRRHVYPGPFIKNLIERDRSKLQWYAVFDPGTTTCFAVLFACINPYTSQVFLLDEIYERQREETQASKIWERAEKIKQAHFPRLAEWRNVYDEAAAWFANEVAAPYGAALTPTRKAKERSKEDTRPGESLIKTLMDLEHKLFISEKCKNLIWEIENYVTNDKGQYPVKNDHLLDCLHYLVTDSYFSIAEDVDTEETQIIESQRIYGELAPSAIKVEPESNLWDLDGSEDLWVN